MYPRATVLILIASASACAHGTLTNVTRSECLRFAFKIHNDSQIVGPDWIKDHRVLFNIVAQAPEATAREELRRMTLDLLTQRFQLNLHHEDRQLSYLALVVDKNGPKMPETKAGTAGVRQVVRSADQPILDMTGLKGEYDVQLEWTPDQGTAAVVGTGVPSLFAAVREQLGLKLEARKGPLDVVVVDHVERVPLPN